MKHHDDRQSSLFDELLAVASRDEAPKPTIVRPVFDPRKLRITEHEGEPFVLDLDLGQELGYAEPRQIRQLIRRLTSHSAWGGLYYRNTNPSVAGGRPGTEYLLTEKQIVLVCMRAELPNLEEVQSLIADVFIAWRHGQLRAADAKTEVDLQEATDRAVDLLAFFDQFGAEQRRMRKAVEANNANRRKDPSAETVRIGRWVVKFNYLDRCPCCRRVIIGPDYKYSHWGHMKGHARNGVRDGWPICEKCNRDWEDSKNTEDITIAFIAYLRHVEAYLAQGQFQFRGKP